MLTKKLLATTAVAVSAGLAMVLAVVANGASVIGPLSPSVGMRVVSQSMTADANRDGLADPGDEYTTTVSITAKSAVALTLVGGSGSVEACQGNPAGFLNVNTKEWNTGVLAAGATVVCSYVTRVDEGAWLDSLGSSSYPDAIVVLSKGVQLGAANVDVPMDPDAKPPLPGNHGLFRAVTPYRAHDSRLSGGPIASKGVRTVQVVGGATGVPATGVRSVVVNLTVVSPTGAGYLTAYASGSQRPPSSNVNFSAGQTVAAMAVVPVGDDGRIDIFHGSDAGHTDVVVDITGFYRASEATQGSLVTLPSAVRLVDTRIGLGVRVALAPGQEVDIPVEVGGHRQGGSIAALVNLTVTGQQSEGHLRAWDGSGGAVPNASNLNFAPGADRANMAAVPLSASATFRVKNASVGSLHLVVDLVGLYNDLGRSASEPGAFVPIVPTRVTETRASYGGSGSLVGPSSRQLDLVTASKGRVPAGASAIVANVTVINPQSSGHGLLYPYGTARPIASTVNFDGPGDVVPNLTSVGVAGGKTVLYGYVNGAQSRADYIVDIQGYFLQ